MSQASNGGGKRSSGLLSRPQKSIATPPPSAPTAARDTQVTFRAGDDQTALHGVPVRMARHIAVFELFNPLVTPRLSEALADFKVSLNDRSIYAGRAVVQNIVNAGTKVVCEVALNEASWQEAEGSLANRPAGEIAEEFNLFLKDWQKFYKVSSEFKVVVADMQTFLHDLRLWLDKVELGLQTVPGPRREEREREILLALCTPALTAFASLFEKFEKLASATEPDARVAHSL
ncbi:MAG TPA: hypothetical protein VH251_05000, partial [Verrucomicrobiae bacterium]|nr:hypothetical protein [Verrucomicrobiae bacterium]